MSTRQKATNGIICMAIISLIAGQAKSEGITGRIIDQKGFPISGASVRLAQESQYETLSDEDGSFMLDATGGGIAANTLKTSAPDIVTIRDGRILLSLPPNHIPVTLNVFAPDGRVITTKQWRGSGVETVPFQSIIPANAACNLVIVSISFDNLVFSARFLLEKNLQGTVYRLIGSGKERPSGTSLSKATVSAVDTVIISKEKYGTRRRAVESYHIDLGDITLVLMLLPDTYKLTTPLSLGRRQEGIKKRQDLAADVNTETCGQEVVKMALSEIEAQTTSLSEIFAMIDNVLPDIDPGKVVWHTDLSAKVQQEDIDKISTIDGDNAVEAFEFSEGDDYPLAPFIFVDSAHFREVIDSLNKWKPVNIPAITVETGSFDALLVICNTTPAGETPVLGDRIGLTFILWTYDRSSVRVKTWDRMFNDELFQVEFNYDDIGKISSLFYYYHFNADWSNPDIENSHVILSMTMKEIDSLLHGMVFDFAFQKILGDVGHDFQFFVRGFADDSGGYAELKRRYNPEINSMTFTSGLAGIGRSRELFGSDAAISSRMGFSSETAETIDDWFVIPGTGDWDENAPYPEAFGASFTEDFHTSTGTYGTYSVTDRNFISVKAPDDLSFDTREFDKLFLVTENGYDPTTWNNVIGSFVTALDDYTGNASNLVQTVFLYGITGTLPDTIDIHEITGYADTEISDLTTRTLILDTAAGIYE